MSSVARLWQAPAAVPNGTALLTNVLQCLDGVDVLRLLQVEKRSRNSVRRLLSAFQTARARLALALLSFWRLRVEFRPFYQELQMRTIPRSSDARVPPRVVSIWSEKGEVSGGAVTLKPIELPSVHRDGVGARFVADAGKRPMLTNVVQRNRRIYTMVMVKLLRSDAEDSDDGLVLRHYSYLKECGEWKAPTVPEKRLLAAASIGSRRGRFDLLSQDGSVALELEVPSGTEAHVDYYLVKQVAVSLHMQELLQFYFHSVRPIRALPEPGRREACTISVTLRTMAGILVSGCRMPGSIVIERQDGADDKGSVDHATDTPSEDGTADPPVQVPTQQTRGSITRAPPRQRTGIERFEVVTCQATCTSEPNPSFNCPKTQGMHGLRCVVSVNRPHPNQECLVGSFVNVRTNQATTIV